MQVEELTTTEIAARLGVTVRTVQRWIREKKLDVKPVPGRRYAVDALGLENMLSTKDKVHSTEDRVHTTMQDRVHAQGFASQPGMDQVFFERIVDLQMEVHTLSARLVEAEKRIGENVAQTEVEQDDYTRFPGDLTPIMRLTESIGITPAVLAMAILEWDDAHSNDERDYWKRKKSTAE